MKYQPKHARTAPEQNSAKRAFTGAAIGAAALTTVGVAQASESSAASSSDILAKIAFCESSGNPHAQNPGSTASGLFQDLTTTWQSLPGTAGYANAKDAPASVQIAANEYMFAHDGTDPWLASEPCWSRLSSAPFTLASLGGSASNASVAAVTATTSHAAAAAMKPAAVTKPATATVAPAKPAASPAPVAITLNAQDNKALSTLSDLQKKQPWWNADAARGTTVLRTITSAATTRASSDARSAKAGTIAAGTNVSGHYVNTDWFLITQGAHAGQYVNTSFVDLTTANIKNGHLSASQLAALPSYLSAAGQQLTPSAAKQFVLANAAYRTATGHNLYVTGAYRSFATQQVLYTRYGATYAMRAGTSPHGLGLAINATPTASATSWLKAHGSALGWITTGDGLLNSVFSG